MTPALCQAFCDSKNYPFAGVEYGTQCYCGLGLASPAVFGATGCTMACPGSSSSTCGGKSRLDVYTNASYVYPVVVPSVATSASLSGNGKATFLGCFADSSTSRTLNKMSWKSSTDVTVEACAAKCATKGYGVSGVEYGGECYCDSAPPAVGGPTWVDNVYECRVSFCTGNSTEYCGGKSRLLVYA